MDYTSEVLTLETRWFEPGTPPDALSDWFTALESVETSGRTDLYLHPHEPSLNVKLRDDYGDLLQIKRRLGSPTKRTFGPDVTGRAEQWYKWSFSLDYTPDFWEADRTDLWIPVEKTRMKRTFDSDESESLGDGLPDSTTVATELTEVVAEENTAWSFCLEASGPPESLDETLDSAGSTLLDEAFPVSLAASHSFGYAGWFRRVLSSDSRPPSEILTPANR